MLQHALKYNMNLFLPVIGVFSVLAKIVFIQQFLLHGFFLSNRLNQWLINFLYHCFHQLFGGNKFCTFGSILLGRSYFIERIDVEESQYHNSYHGCCPCRTNAQLAVVGLQLDGAFFFDRFILFGLHYTQCCWCSGLGGNRLNKQLQWKHFETSQSIKGRSSQFVIVSNETDFIVGLVGTFMVFEAARRVVGWPMITVAFFFMVYAFFGPYIPGILAHRGVGVQEMFDHLFFTTEGIFGTPMGVSSTFIYLFILFGAYLETTGLGKFFIDIANAIAGWAAGGPAKVAVISSALEGMYSGSSVANTVGSGSITIPLMKKTGYKPEFAAAAEAAASTGGQIMPPIMGAAAFLMAENLSISYSTIIVKAILPAILYFAGVFIAVHLEAKKHGLRGLSKEEIPDWKPLIKKVYLLIPLNSNKVNFLFI